MPAKLPKGWVETTLGEACARVATIQPEDSPDTEFTYFDIGGIDNQSNRVVEARTLLGREAPSRARQSVRKDDILFSTVRTYLKKIARIEHDYPNPIASTGFAVIRAAQGVLPKFLLSQALSEDFLQPLHALQSGSSYPAVRDKDVFAQPIRLAPTREQERIVAKLDALLSQVDAGEAAARRALDRLQRYRAAVLHAAVTGELTREWRKTHPPKESSAQLLKRLLVERRARWEEAELKRLHASGNPSKDNNWKKRYPKPKEPKASELPAIPESWKWASAAQLTDATRAITYGVIKLGSNVPRGVPVLRSSNVRRLELDLENVKHVSRKIADEYERTYLSGGEVLLTVRGTLGGVVAVPPECAGYNISREVGMFALLAPESARTIALFIASDLLQQWLSKRAKGVAYTGINIETLHQLPLPVPPLEEQRQIRSEVERRLKRATELEAAVERQLAGATAMRQSLLREAFSGNLVSQDPQDESAAVLLERLKAERIRQTAEGKVVRRRIPRSPKGEAIAMRPVPSADTLQATWRKIGKKRDAKRLFVTAGFSSEQVVAFYELLRSDSQIREAFELPQKRKRRRVPTHIVNARRLRTETIKPGRFRLVLLWLENFKNLKDYEVRFGPGHGFDVVLGWNGTGKSNLFEALVIIFRDLHYWWEKSRWPNEPMTGYRLQYEIEEYVVEVKWDPSRMRRPEVTKAAVPTHNNSELEFKPINRQNLPLPRFVFGYYSGPT
ncbi:MAG TPA: restriction endonuclease subunit S, partial [Tepidisphaeraceae bacterium]|nr:restriction endonuclease subunit S [Tepidisphaeraceae bacterium]